MPTGYTSDVANGKITEFNDYAIRCARNFGALCTVRDEPLDSGRPEKLKASQYNAEHLVVSQKRLAEINGYSEEDCHTASDREHGKTLKMNREEIARIRKIRSRYEAMIVKVEKWEPPSEDHKGMKNFMIDQLNDSIRSDCSEEYYSYPKKLSGDEWKKKRNR